MSVSRDPNHRPSITFEGDRKYLSDEITGIW
jgi:hypothetical protein